MPPAYVSFESDINTNSVEQLLGYITGLIAEKTDEIHLLISSPGGDSADAVAAYNVLRGLPVRLITHNVGRVASAANAIFLAGDPRYACRISSFHYHRCLYDLREQAKVDTHQIRESLDMMRSDDWTHFTIIADRTLIAPDEVKRMLREGAVKDPDTALADGIIHEIREVSVPTEARFVQLAFRRPGK